MDEKIIEQFKVRKIKAKSIFSIKEIPKKIAYDFIQKYHYLGKAKFLSIYNFGLFHEDELVGVSTFSNPQGISTLKGWFGLPNQEQTILELSRLCMLPTLNGTNATSFLLGNSIKLLRKEGIRAIITLADSNRHNGAIYQVCNFKYYGLTDAKTDFFSVDGRKNPRGATKDMQGVWLPRTRKHRYCYIIDKKLKVNYKEQKPPKKEDIFKIECCEGTKEVFDKRFGKWYTCPKCCGKLEETHKN